MRKQTQDVTKAFNGIWYVITWEWKNGWNIVDSRRATEKEIETRKVDA